MKKLVMILSAATMFASQSALAHSGHQHHALQSTSHAVTDTLLLVGAVVFAIAVIRALILRNES